MDKLDTGIQDRRLLLHWLASRQTSFLAPDDDSSDDEDKGPSDHALPHGERQCAGFNGRPNKYADTCYCWWVGATIMVRIQSRSAHLS
jgi:geranylgeranyl transferase type-1 subunit beta